MMDYMTTLVRFHRLALHLNTLSFRLNLLHYFRLMIHHCFHRLIHLMMLHMSHWFDMNHLLYIRHFHPINNMMDYMTTLVHFHRLAPHLNTSLLHYYFHQMIHRMMILHSMMVHRIR